MGYIKEAKRRWLYYSRQPLTDEERKQISKFIRDYKAKYADKKSSIKAGTSALKQKALAWQKEALLPTKSICNSRKRRCNDQQ